MVVYRELGLQVYTANTSTQHGNESSTLLVLGLEPSKSIYVFFTLYRSQQGETHRYYVQHPQVEPAMPRPS